MIFTRRNGGSIDVPNGVAAQLVAYRQLAAAHAESGGILLGRLILGTHDVVVDEVTIPASRDRRGRFFFWRAKTHAQDRVNTAWSQSCSTRIYLGEWHTHPEDDPQPSSKDVQNWRRIVKRATYEQNSLFFVIVGRELTRTWELARDEETVIPCPICPTERSA